jgi:HlyD family secretion protein
MRSTVDRTYFIEMRRSAIMGFVVVLTLVLGTGVWATTTQISGAVIAPGRLVVLSEVKKVQHPTGGIVGSILVDEGDEVSAGDALVVLDDTTTRANLAVITHALDELLARQARLRSERDGDATIHYPRVLTARITDPDVSPIIAGEQRLFELRRIALEGNKSRLQERKAQSQQEILGLEQQIDSKNAQLALIVNELDATRQLWAKKLTSLAKLNSLEREAVKMRGESAALRSNIAETRGQIAEIDLQVLQVDRQFNSEVADQLREADAKIGELLERKVAAEDLLRRIVIRAPATGIIHDLSIHTVGGVIGPGEPLMLIVPVQDKLEVESRVRPTDIDQLQVGAPVRLRLTSFNQRTTPEIMATLKSISADVETDQRSGESWYKVRVSISQQGLTPLGSLKLIPGMPVETYIETSQRNVVSLLIKPLSDQMYHAFRED